MQDRESFYRNLKTKLDETTQFPADYLYKFIVSAAGNKVEEVQKIFDNKGAVIQTKKSKNGKYISISIVVKLSSSNEVIEYYQQAEKIEGIISL